LNISRGLGDGKAQVLDFTPVIRQMQNLYVAEERKRQAAQKLYEDTVAQYDPKRAKLRSPDVPRYVQDYQEYANAKRMIHSGKVKDPLEIAALNEVADKAAGRMQLRVAKSLEQADFEKNAAQALWSKPDEFEDYTPEVIASMKNSAVDDIETGTLAGYDFRKTPQLMGQDLRNIQLYAAKQFDPNKIKHWTETSKIKDAEYDGKGMVREVETEVLKLAPDQIIMDAHKWFNSDKAAARDFYRIFKQEQQSGAYDQVVETFYQKYPQFKGKPIVDPATYYAARHLASFEPKVSTGKWDFTPQKKHANQINLLSIREAIIAGRQEEVDNRLEQYVSSIENDAIDSDQRMLVKRGQKADFSGNKIKESPDLAAALSVATKDGKLLKPDMLLVQPNGTWLSLIYKRQPDKIIKNGKAVTNPNAGQIVKSSKGEPVIDQDLTTEFTRVQVKGNINKYYSSKIPKVVVSPSTSKKVPQSKGTTGKKKIDW